MPARVQAIIHKILMHLLSECGLRLPAEASAQAGIGEGGIRLHELKLSRGIWFEPTGNEGLDQKLRRVDGR
jgi:hypothetical protein